MISRRDAEAQRMTENDIGTNDILCVSAPLREKKYQKRLCREKYQLKWGSYLITVP